MRNDRERLLDIQEAIEQIEKYSAQGNQAFEQNDLIQVWIVHHLQIIGEASRSLSESTKEQAPAIPWSSITGMRHVLVHSYFGIDHSLVWAAVEKLPELKIKIGELLLRLSPSPRGATMLEFALVFPVLLVMILSILDFAHVLAVRAILTKAAENGVNIATKIPNFDVDVAGPETSQVDKDNFCEARRRILEEATRLPLNTLVSDFNIVSGSQLVKYEYDTNCLDPVTGNIVEWGAGVIRPGEMVKREEAGVLKDLNHQILAPLAGQTLKPEVLMKRAPIYVELEAKVKMFLPFLGTITTSGVAYGFREDVPRGGFGSAGNGGGGGGGGGGGTTTTSTMSTTTTTGGMTTTTLTPCVVDWQFCVNNSKIINQPLCPAPDAGPGGKCKCIPCKGPPEL